MHPVEPPDAPRPEQPPISTRELILRASDAIGEARVLVRETAAYWEEFRALRETVRARREGRGPPWR